jgi:hypothetical protein
MGESMIKACHSWILSLHGKVYKKYVSMSLLGKMEMQRKYFLNLGRV